MFKTIMNREKRKQLQEYVEVAFAVATIAAFAGAKYRKHQEEKALAEGVVLEND